MPCGNAPKDLCPDRVGCVRLVNVMIGAVLIRNEPVLVDQMARDVYELVAVLVAHLNETLIQKIDIAGFEFCGYQTVKA